MNSNTVLVRKSSYAIAACLECGWLISSNALKSIDGRVYAHMQKTNHRVSVDTGVLHLYEMKDTSNNLTEVDG